MTNWVIVFVVATTLPGLDPAADLKSIQQERIRAAQELFDITARLYKSGAVSAMDYQNARLWMLAVTIDAAPTPEARIAAMKERVEACEQRLKYLTTPGVALSPIEAEAQLPAARVELAEARFAITPIREDREKIVQDTLKEIDANQLDQRTIAELSKTEQLELRLFRLGIKARLLALLND